VQLAELPEHLPIMRVAALLTPLCRFTAGFLLCCLPQVAPAQQAGLPDNPQPQQQQTNPKNNGQKRRPSPNRIFWVIPNYRADESSAPFKPLSSRAKLKLALDDAFDPSAFLVTGVIAGFAMAERQYPGFGNGAAGYGKYYGGAFGDQTIGDMMTEAIFPIAFHQDPRYFVKAKGGIWKRAGYAISREVITRNDDGRDHFNVSELGGNAVAAGVSNLYYPAAQRSLANTSQKWGEQIGLDAFFNILKEFWPDVRTRLFGP
jgi:hypothetical protein